MGMRLKRFHYLALVLLALLLGAPLGWAQTIVLQDCQTGNALFTQKQYDTAIRYYRAALDSDPENWQAFQGLGNCYYAKGDNARALANYQRSLSLHPDNPPLAAFAKSLRAKMDASTKKIKSARLTEEEEKFLKQGSGASLEHFELAPSVGIVLGDLNGIVAGIFGIDGFGLGGSVFYVFGDGVGLGGWTHFYFLDGGGTVFELVPAIKLKFGGKVVSPYLVGGGGLGIASAAAQISGPYYGGSTGALALAPVVEFGAGLEFPLQQDLSLFVEGKGDLLFGNYGAVSYVPFEAGVLFNNL